jgi:hypothetical protein
VHIDPEVGIPDLIKRLTDDSKRLVKDEVRLAKLETSEKAKTAAKGAMWMGLAFGVGVVMLIALTVAVAAGIGEIANGNYWLGALLTGALWLGLGFWLIKRGKDEFAKPSYTLEETRAGLKDSVAWVGDARDEARAVTAATNGRHH